MDPDDDIHAIQNAIVLVISGPAGSGKTTLCTRLTESFPRICRLVTTTSRDPRPGEIDGVDYHFLTPQEFKHCIEEGEFVEWAHVHGRYYGSRRKHVNELLDAGKDILLNIDVQGAAAFRDLPTSHPQLSGRIHTVFIKPASPQQLIDRLKHRGTDGPEEIERRLQSALHEIEAVGQFEHVIVSGSREQDFAHLRDLYLKLRNACPKPLP